MNKKENTNQISSKNFNEQFNNVVNQAVQEFQGQIKVQVENGIEPDFDATVLLAIEEPRVLYTYIMNDDFWLAQWSVFLVRQIMGFIYEDVKVVKN